MACSLCREMGHTAPKCPKKEEVLKKKEEEKEEKNRIKLEKEKLKYDKLKKKLEKIQKIWESIPDPDPKLEMINTLNEDVFREINWIVTSEPNKTAKSFDIDEKLSDNIKNRPVSDKIVNIIHFKYGPLVKKSLIGVLTAIYLSLPKNRLNGHIFYEGITESGYLMTGS